MTNPSRVALDASALLALVFDEIGADVVEDAIARVAYISQINWIEVLSTLAERGRDPDDVVSALTSAGVLGDNLIIQPLDDAQMRTIARLRPLTRSIGLSLGDRACLALAQALDVPALTSDRAWLDVAQVEHIEILTLR